MSRPGSQPVNATMTEIAASLDLRDAALGMIQWDVTPSLRVSLDGIYNADHLKKAGIDHAPTTPDELLADAKAVKAKGVVTYPIGLPFSATEGSATAWYLLTKAFGGELFDADGKPLFTAPDSPGKSVPSRTGSSIPRRRA